MGKLPTTSAFLALLILGVAGAEYLRVAKTIPITRHEQELARVRAESEEKVKEAENRYRQALGEEAHRREMSLLFEKATARAISTHFRANLSELEVKSLASELSSVELKSVLGIDRVDTVQVDAQLEAVLRKDWEAVKEAQRRSAARIEARQQATEEEKTQLREKKDRASKELRDALTEYRDALADLSYAKDELEKLGHPVAWPEEILAIVRDSQRSQDSSSPDQTPPLLRRPE